MTYPNLTACSLGPEARVCIFLVPFERKHIGVCEYDRMSVNTSASWSAHALRTRLGMPFGLAALRGLTCLNVLLTSATVNESPESLVNGLCWWNCVILKVCKEGV